jgi:hypothetical protein
VIGAAGDFEYTLADRESALQSLRCLGHERIPAIVEKWAFELGLTTVDPGADMSPSSTEPSTRLHLQQVYRACHVARLENEDLWHRAVAALQRANPMWATPGLDAESKLLSSSSSSSSSSAAAAASSSPPLLGHQTRTRSWLVNSSPLLSDEVIPTSTSAWIQRHTRICLAEREALMHVRDLVACELAASELFCDGDGEATARSSSSRESVQAPGKGAPVFLTSRKQAVDMDELDAALSELDLS